MITANIHGSIDFIKKATKTLENIKIDDPDMYVKIDIFPNVTNKVSPVSSANLTSVEPHTLTSVEPEATVTDLREKKVAKKHGVKKTKAKSSKQKTLNVEVTKEQVHESLMKVNNEKGLVDARKTLEHFNVAKISEVYDKPDIWKSFVAHCEKVLGA